MKKGLFKKYYLYIKYYGFLLFFSLLFSAQVQADAVTSIRLVLPTQSDPVVTKIVAVFTRQVQSRCNATVITEGKAPLTVELLIESGIGEEGFQITDGGSGVIRIRGNDKRGLLYGVGKFLHTSTYGNAGFLAGSWRGVSVPASPVRGIYLATHFNNFYHVAPVEKVTNYIEDLSLWGANSFLVWFGREAYDSIDDPAAQAQLARLRILLQIVKDLGLNASMGCICNDAYKNSPVELRADSSTVDHEHYHTLNGPRIYNLGHELCPSKPGVPEMEIGYVQEMLDAFQTVGLDYWFFAPYDNGGCTCALCAPWGSNGYLRIAEMLAQSYRTAYPQGKIIMSTWYFNRWAYGEWEGISAQFNQQQPDWVDYLMIDNFEEYPSYPLEHGVPGGLPAVNFPDVSMWGQDPWGGYGANPMPERLQQRWNQTKHILSGGFPYSEGIYEDINKVICSQLYWEPDKPTMDTVGEYIAFEFSLEVVDTVKSVVSIFHENHLRDQIGASAVTAYQLIGQVDTLLTPQARSAWRWRLFCIRAAIDQELYRNSQGRGRQEVFRQAYEELIAISHAENTWPMLRPVVIPAVDVIGPSLSANYAEVVAASKPVAWWRMNNFYEHNVEDATGHKNGAVCENGVVLGPSDSPSTSTDKKLDSRAACFSGGRIKAKIAELADTYSVEFWFYNTMPHTARPVTGYIFSRGLEGPEGTPGDDLGISGTSSIDKVPPGRLFFYNGDAAKLVVGKTDLAGETWNHVVLVRDGKRIAVYLNGNSMPEISGEMEKGYPDNTTQLFVGGRNDNFANFRGKIAEASVYNRALTREEAVQHYKAAAYLLPGK